MSVTTTSTSVETETKPQNRLRPRRTLNRLAIGLLALAVGGVAQAAFEYGSLWDGLILYVIAAVVFVRALGNRIYPAYKFRLPNPRMTGALTATAGWAQRGGVWLIALAVVSSIFSYSFFGQDGSLKQAWWLYAASLVLFVAGGVLLTPSHSLRAEFRRLFPGRRITLILALIMGLALALRLYNFTLLPFGIWFDEAEAGLAARHILQNPEYHPVFFQLINVTGHFLALYALALNWLGDNIYSLRLMSVLFGVGSVFVAYLFGRELRGPRFGLALAFLVAVARWHINFSRIAMTGIDTPFFEFLTLFFLTRLFRRQRLRDALWAGLTIAVGLVFYTAFRLFVVALLILAIIAMVRWPKSILDAMRQGGWQRYLNAAILAVLACWLVIMPVVKFAIDHPGAFMYRTQQISIFTKRDQPDLVQAVWESTQKHLLMFNFEGDKNGRHNLPGAPMLDPITGVLFVLGLALALARTRHPANLFFLILFPVALLGGIFSVDFEAPQSLRSIAVIPAVIYFAGLSIAALGREAEQVLQPLPRAWITVPAAAVAIIMLWLNTYSYFIRQANDFASWNAFSAAETITGRQMAKLGPDYAYILSPFLTNHPTTQFLAPEAGKQEFLNMPDALPVRDSSGQPVAMFIHPDDQWVYDEARQMYPNAEFETFTGPAPVDAVEGPPSVYLAKLTADDLTSVRGLDLRYLSTEGDAETLFFTAPLETRRAFNINTTWPEESPVNENFVAEWNGILYAPAYGPYRFRLVTPDTGILEIDGNTIFNGQDEQVASVTLAEGNHQIRVRAEAGQGQVALYWQPPTADEELVPAWALYTHPVTNHGLLGTFYPNDSWSGEPALQRIDPFLDTYFHLIPLQRPYTVEWTGSLIAPQTGIYRLGLRAVQEAELFIDGQHLLTTQGPDQYTEASVTLDVGLHNILIRYRDSVDRSRIHLTWIPPNGQFQPIPSDYLWPPMGQYPEPSTQLPETVETQPISLKHLISIGTPGSEAGQFLEPRDVAVLSNGNLVVADTGNRRVQIFDPQYRHMQNLTGDDLPFEEPLAVAVNSRNEIFVLDSALQWIYQFDAQGSYLSRFGGPAAQLFHPRGLAIFADDTIAVADTGSAQIKLFTPNGDQVGSIGSIGTAPGNLNEPTDVLRDSQGAYLVAEAETDRIQRLDAAGQPLNQWAIPPAFAFNGPHLAFAPDDSIFVTESQSSTLQRYSPDGMLLDQWQEIDSVRFVEPIGIYFDGATDRLYITDVATHQVHVFWVQMGAGQTFEEE